MEHLEQYKINIDVVDFYYLKGFETDPKILNKIIEIIDAHSTPSSVAEQGERRVTDFRTSQTCYLDKYVTDEVRHLEKKIIDTVKIPLAKSEPIQGQKYEIGQYFKEHTDFFPPNSDTYKTFAPNDNQRTWTFMLYLNDVEEGGFTRFPQLKLQFKPKAGDALLWNNLHPEDGTENDWTSHQALPPESGRKYIITQWFRRMDYRTPLKTEYSVPEDRLSRPCGGQVGFDDFVERWHE